MQKISIRKKIAIFGGKFDPPHLGHQILIFLLLEKFKMDEVWIEPTFSHPFNYKTSNFTLRHKMAQLLAIPWKNQKKVIVRDDERIIGKTPLYTINLVKYLIQKFPEQDFYLAIGEDNFKQRDKWKNFDEIEQLCKIIVIGRGNNFSKYISIPNISSSFIKEQLKQNKNVSHLLSSEVFNFIKEHNLYFSNS